MLALNNSFQLSNLRKGGLAGVRDRGNSAKALIYIFLHLPKNTGAPHASAPYKVFMGKCRKPGAWAEGEAHFYLHNV